MRVRVPRRAARRSYQTETIKNTFLHRVSFIQHIFTRVIPPPLPHNHPMRKKHCFYTQPLRYSDQVSCACVPARLPALLQLSSMHAHACDRRVALLCPL